MGNSCSLFSHPVRPPTVNNESIPAVVRHASLPPSSIRASLPPSSIRASLPPSSTRASLQSVEKASQTNAVDKNYAKNVYCWTHPRHGELTITRRPKAAKENSATFEIELNNRVNDIHSMFISLHDDEFGGHSTLGYNDIFLAEGLQGKGVSYLLHAVAAETAKLMNLEKFAIGSVVSNAMHTACAGCKMEDNGIASGYYSADPSTVFSACQLKIREKGWRSIPA